MLKHIAEALGWCESSAGAPARDQFARDYPAFACEGTRLRAAEAERFVVAVFYQPDLLLRPAPYKLYSVSRDLAHAEELNCEPSSPYWIRGRK